MSTLIKKSLPMIDLTCTDKGNSTYLLKITVPQNEIGIIYKVTAVLFAYNWNIEEAIAETVDGKFVKEVFIIKNLDGIQMTDQGIRKIKSDLTSMLNEELSVFEFLEKSGKSSLSSKEPFPSVVHVFNPPSIDFTVLDIRTLDRPGLLCEISKILYLFSIDIISFTANTEDRKIRDSFLLCDRNRMRLTEDACESLKDQLLAVLN